MVEPANQSSQPILKPSVLPCRATKFKPLLYQIILTELLTGGELFEKVAADDFELTEAEVVVFMREITEGVRYIHQQVWYGGGFNMRNLFEISRPALIGNSTSRSEARKRGVLRLLRRRLFVGQDNRLRSRQKDRSGSERQGMCTAFFPFLASFFLEITWIMVSEGNTSSESQHMLFCCTYL